MKVPKRAMESKPWKAYLQVNSPSMLNGVEGRALMTARYTGDEKLFAAMSLMTSDGQLERRSVIMLVYISSGVWSSPGGYSCIALSAMPGPKGDKRFLTSCL